MIPLFSLEKQNKQLSVELHDAINQVIYDGKFILGPRVSELENKIAEYLGIKYAVGVASGTDALSLGLLSLGLQAGDEVIMPANSYPSAFGVTSVGIVPRLVDIDSKTYTIDPNLIVEAITPKTRAILAVHLYGQAANLPEILAIAKKFGLFVVEDCAQAIGSSIKYYVSSIKYEEKNKKIPNTKYVIRNTVEKKVGSIGDIGCFSFYPTKNLGCFGDGGMVTTNNEEIYKKLKLYRMYGEAERYNSVLLGKNSRLDEIQAAILLVKLKYLDIWNKRRREIAQLYKSQIQNPNDKSNPKSKIQNLNLKATNSQPTTHNIQLPFESSYCSHIYHLFVIRTKMRNELKKYLEEKGIQTAIHYPVPIHMEPSFKFLGYKEGDFPESEKASRGILSLPVFPELTNGEILKVVETIKRFFQK